MKYVAEFRDPELAARLVHEIRRLVNRPWKIMEVCGGQTHSIIRNGLDQLLPSEIELLHGPGCPVCVTPLETIDRALAIAARPEVIFCSFGDMLRVPGSEQDLFRVKAEGADVRIVYSPLDALKIARANPNREVVFFGVGFETTAPANAMTVHAAKREGIRNFSMLISHVLVPPAMEAILQSPQNQVQGFLAAGHVCSVMGYWQYPAIAAQYGIPIVITGFEPLDLLEGIRRMVSMLQRGEHGVENAYDRVVTLAGNTPAQELLEQVFEVTDRTWRGIGVIPQSGWRLRAAYQEFDAELRFDVGDVCSVESRLCHSGEVLRGSLKPPACPAFGKQCTPRHPLGATMVSSEGACAAYYDYGRFVSLQELAVEDLEHA